MTDSRDKSQTRASDIAAGILRKAKENQPSSDKDREADKEATVNGVAKALGRGPEGNGLSRG